MPRTSSAARRRSSQRCLRSSCVRSHGSAPPLRRGAAARQFPPSLCRCADHPLRGIPLTPGGLRAPQTPRGPQAPFVGPSGHYLSVMEAPPPNLRCSPAQGLGVVVSKAFSFHTPPPWAAPRGAAVQAPVPLPMESPSICIGPGGEPKALPLHTPPPWAAPRGGLVGDSLTRKTGSTR